MTLLREMQRKWVHLFWGGLIPILYYFLPTFVSQILLIIITGIFLVLEFLRLNHPTIKNIFHGIFGSVIRQHEHTSLTGATYLLLSALTCSLTMKKIVVVTAMGYLVFGDTTAALAGKKWGRFKIFNKTLEGSLACFLSCLVIGLITVNLPNSSLSYLIIVVGAVVATLTELFPIPLDDNLRIPLISGGVIQILLKTLC